MLFKQYEFMVNFCMLDGIILKYKNIYKDIVLYQIQKGCNKKFCLENILNRNKFSDTNTKHYLQHCETHIISKIIILTTFSLRCCIFCCLKINFSKYTSKRLRRNWPMFFLIIVFALYECLGEN